jgi:hypothetical protein
MAFSFFLVNGALPGAPISRQNRVDQITSDNPYKPNKSNGLFGGNIQVGKEATLTAMTALRERRRTQIGQHRFLIRCPSYRQNGCVQQGQSRVAGHLAGNFPYLNSLYQLVLRLHFGVGGQLAVTPQEPTTGFEITRC